MKPNYGFAKRQRELAKKQKKEEKKLRKQTEETPQGEAVETPEAAQVKAAEPGFPAGVKWGFCPPGVFPRYLVVNGDESEPGTYKDRILMERDPHQLIEGVLLACYAIGAGLKFNLPMLAKGDSVQLTAAYANGMTDYTSFYTYASDNRNVGGYVTGKTSAVLTATGIENVKSWNVAAVFEHYWAPQYRSVLFASYGQLDAPTTTKTRVWNGTTGFGDATTWNIGTNFAWLPTKGFEIGVEVIYARVNQDVRGYTAASTALLPVTAVSSKSDSNVTGRLRVERTF